MSMSTPVSAQLDRLAVEDTMHPGLIGCDPNAQLGTLADEQIRCVVVHGIEDAAEGERPTWGIVTAADIIRALDAGDWGVTARDLVTAELVTVAYRRVGLREPARGTGRAGACPGAVEGLSPIETSESGRTCRRTRKGSRAGDANGT